MRGWTRRLRAIALGAVCVCGALSASLAHAADAADAEPLPAYGADLQRTSVSGLSSGAFMAAQFDVAYSSQLIGAGIVAGGAFRCAVESSMTAPAVAAMTLCMQPLGPAPDATSSWKYAQALAKTGDIDDVANLRKQRIYLFNGGHDAVVSTSVVDEARHFYDLAGVPKANVSYRKDPNAGHALITNHGIDASCGTNAMPYINNCGFDQADDILNWIYASPDTKLNPPAVQAGGNLLAFDQREFDRDRRASLADTGYVYLPVACASAACAVHVVFHGCEQGASFVGERFVRGAGYNETADTNRVIVLYPQVDKSVANPIGCWDFWGYTSANANVPDFYAHDAPQMVAVKQMIERLGQPRP
ncbi:extracellular catalytic domain type 2 short-chain-length polyhydroxyalkanoate depolymerase [Paraburkholderia sp.]|uniref:extracellular catalytic domain type 2 short-chain-length polyhydroxyalkanoate depolymerase n=1 Tax=Paraburkholderia sp. TaxID=1926495 RepID=UPI003D6EFD5A